MVQIFLDPKNNFKNMLYDRKTQECVIALQQVSEQ